MIQDKIKTQINQLKQQSGDVREQVQKFVSAGQTEAQRILKELGVTDDVTSIALSELVANLRKSNPTLKTFFRNLNVATYDNRFRWHWNSHMISAYARQQAEKTYSKEVKPKLESVVENFTGQVQEIRSKLAS